MNIFPWLILFTIFLIFILILQNAIKFLEKHIMENMYSKIIFSSVFTADISFKKILLLTVLLLLFIVHLILFTSIYFIYAQSFH